MSVISPAARPQASGHRAPLRFALRLAAVVTVLGASPALATPVYVSPETVPAVAIGLGFSCVTAIGTFDCNAAQRQISATVHQGTAPADVWFTFFNARAPFTGAVPSSIARVYFDDRPETRGAAGPLSDLYAIANTSGVRYVEGASPKNLPGGSTISFVADESTSARSPAPANGVNVGEYLQIAFTLSPSYSYGDVIAALRSGDLRVGMHVIAFEDGGSVALVNDPLSATPEPASLLLVGSALAGLAARRRRRH